jgi:hypothetical protein
LRKQNIFVNKKQSIHRKLFSKLEIIFWQKKISLTLLSHLLGLVFPAFLCGDLNGFTKRDSAKNRAAFEFCC